MNPTSSSNTEKHQKCGRWIVENPPTSPELSQATNVDCPIPPAPTPSQSTNKEGNLVEETGSHGIISERRSKIEIEEKKAEIIVAWLEAQLELLDAHIKEFPDLCQRWKQSIRTIIDRYNERPLTTVALYGATSSGKSSIIQALCQRQAIVKTSSECAGTHYTTTIAYNDRNPKMWRAEIHTITIDEWKSDLQTLMKDIQLQVGDTQKSVLQDEDVSERLEQAQCEKYAVDKIRHVYRNLEEKDLRSMSVDEVMSQLDLSDTLGRIHEFEGETLTKLSKSMELLPGSGTELAKSPLVSILKIFGPFQFLQKGLQLADIPGMGDADGARGRLAEKYQENVDAFWIVSPIQRAVDSQVLWDNFRLAWKQMELRHVQNPAEHITFVLSRCDEIDTLESLKKTHVDAKLQGLIKRHQNLHTEIYRSSKRLSPEKLARLKIAKDEIFEKLSHNAIFQRSQSSMDSLQRTLALFQKDGRENLASQSEISAPTLAENPTCSVFCVSSKAHEQLSGRDKGSTAPGFPTKYDTQIPQLREHCLWASLHAREEHNRKFSESVTIFKDEVKSWAFDCSPEKAITAQQGTALKDKFGVILQNFEQSIINQLNENFRQLYHHSLQNFETSLREATEQAAGIAELVVKSWFKARNLRDFLHWATLRACAHKHGEAFKSRVHAVPVCLNARLAKPYIERKAPARKAYVESFEIQRDNLLRHLTIESNSLFQAVAMHIRDICGIWGIQEWNGVKGHLMGRLTFMLNHDLIKHYDNWSLKVRDTERKLRPVISRYMSPAYDECVGLYGRGLTSELQRVLGSHVNSISQTMYDAARYQDRTREQEKLVQLEFGLAKSLKEYMLHIRQQLHDMLRTSHEKDISEVRPEKLAFQKILCKGLWDLDRELGSQTMDTSNLDFLAEAAIFRHLEDTSAAAQKEEENACAAAQEGEEDYVPPGEYEDDFFDNFIPNDMSNYSGSKSILTIQDEDFLETVFPGNGLSNSAPQSPRSSATLANEPENIATDVDGYRWHLFTT